MRGVVKFINTRDQLVAVLTEHDEYTILGIMDESPVGIGDVINGDLESLDHQLVLNETRGTRISIYIEDCELTEQGARIKLQ